jgi:S-adenosylmethionine decarboxylase
MSTDKHLKILVLGSPFEILSSAEKIGDFVVALIKQIGMRPLGQPHVYDIKNELIKAGLEPYPEEPDGITAICVLSTSHVAISTWPHRAYAVLDIFSCKHFDTEITRKFLEDNLMPSKMKVHDISFSMDGLDELPIVHPPTVAVI